MSASLTLLDVTSRATPKGMKAMPMAKKAGKTVLAVSMGCHAGNFCCLNLVSGEKLIKVSNSTFLDGAGMYM